MTKAIIILGNGFDLDLGLNTSYAEFAKSSQWNGLMNGHPHSLDPSWLLGFLRSKYEVQQWIDIESALLEYALEKTKKRESSHADGDLKDFLSLRRALKEYLKEQQDQFSRPSKKTVASLFIKLMADITAQSQLYTFNYTQLDVLARKCGIAMGKDATHIHGSLADNDDIILGIETNQNVDDRYAFLYKTQNRHYRHTDIKKDLRNKDEYIFFGHALNGMDYPYFESTIFGLASTSTTTSRLTIITKDESEEQRFKIFLRKKNISLQSLYSYSNPVFILTDEVYRGNHGEINKVKALFGRVSAM